MTVVALALFAFAAGCGKEETPPAAAPVQPTVVAPAPTAQAIGDSCSQDCGGGKIATIQCAAGETPVCDCAATPNALCKVPAPAASP
ncbi:MAG TPA: hypothetical protein VM240_14050 [Verrucomicrobiae bacterium]|nr:hypothetical protein [Verrucomicrobiae bacterium]